MITAVASGLSALLLLGVSLTTVSLAGLAIGGVLAALSGYCVHVIPARRRLCR